LLNARQIRSRLGRQALFCLFILMATFLAAHTINAYVAYSLNQPIMISTASQLSQEDITKQNPQQMAQEILDGHLFLLPPNVNTIGAAAQAAPPLPPMEIAKKLSLLGTVTGKGGEAMAIIEELSTKQQRLYGLQEVVLTIGSLAAIEKERVLLRHDAQEEWLDLLITKADRGVVPLVMPGSVIAPVATRDTPPSKSILDRRYLAEVTADLPRLLTHAQAMPNLANGRIDGFRFLSVLPSGFFDTIGLKTNDVVQRINGVEIRDPGSLMSILQQLKQERSVRVDIVRNNQPQILSYEIR
jgi:general secretion pathway protein C